MNKTQIEWTKNPDGTPGFTWNPVTGCLNHVNGMCKGGNFPCYAYRLANTRLRERYLANSCLPTHDEENHEAHHSDPFYPRFWHRKLTGGSPKGIFVCDMGELFGDWIPSWWQEVVFAQIRLFKQHRFYLLTKQPQNLLAWSPFPDNCYVGVTATNAQMFIDAGNALKDIDAKIKYISAEPLLSWDLGGSGFIATMLQKWGINQVIIGAQTKPYKPPKIEWVREIVESCDKAGVKVFIKNNLSSIWDVDLPKWAIRDGGLRQEVPC